MGMEASAATTATALAEDSVCHTAATDSAAGECLTEATVSDSATATDSIQVCDERERLQRTALVVYCPKPDHFTATLDGVSTEQKLWLGNQVGTQSERFLLHTSQSVHGQVDPSKFWLLKECVGGKLVDLVVVQKEDLHAARNVHRPNLTDQVETGIDVVDRCSVVDSEVIFQRANLILVDVQPEQISWHHGVVEDFNSVIGHIEPSQVWQLVEEAVHLGQTVLVEPDCSQLFVGIKRCPLDARDDVA